MPVQVIRAHAESQGRFTDSDELIRATRFNRNLSAQASYRSAADLLQLTKESRQLLWWQFVRPPQHELEIIPQNQPFLFSTVTLR
jgi:hypothetical protein